jgi:hypothetical protein
MKMKCLIRVVGFTLWDRRRNSDIRMEAYSSTNYREGEGHVCRNREDYLVKHIWERKEEGRRGRGRPAKRRMDCVMKDLWQTGMTVEECRRVVLDRER